MQDIVKFFQDDVFVNQEVVHEGFAHFTMGRVSFSRFVKFMERAMFVWDECAKEYFNGQGVVVVVKKDRPTISVVVKQEAC